jgi:NTE family protein/lysophospholipid hydrolase
MLTITQSWFPELDITVQEALEAELVPRTLEPNDVLFQQDTPGQALYLLQEGHLSVTRTEADGTVIPLGEFKKPGTILGEMSLVTGQPRNATVTALAASQLFRLSTASFTSLVEKYPVLLGVFTQWFAARLQEGQIGGVLLNLYGDLDAVSLRAIQDELEWLYMTSGDVLFYEGDQGDAMYIVASGRLRISQVDAAGVEHIRAEVGPGETIGELALLTAENRIATISAARDTILARLTAPVFEKLLEEYPRAVMQITRMVIGRHQRIQEAVIKATKVSEASLGFMLVPINTPDFLASVTPKLVDTLAHFGVVLYLDSQRFDELYGKEGAAQTPFDDVTNLAIIDWLNRQERQYKYIIFVADPEWTVWTERCIRYADRVLIMADADGDPIPESFESRLYEYARNKRIELILFHPDDCRQPRGTAVWLAPRPVQTHHHVRFNNDTDWQRMGRRLVGKAVGIVLSGGGARSLNQIGAIQALQEAGVPIDMIGGVSMGSLTGAAFAVGKSRQEIYDLFHTLASGTKLLDLTLPVASIFASKKVTALFKEAAEDMDVEDTWIPYFCLSANVTKAVPVVHRDGPLWRAMRASMAVPSLFLPVTENGDLLVDGGLMNNLPIDVMAEQMEVGFVIALDNDTNRVQKEKYDFEPGISGWKLLWQRINHFTETPRMPNLMSHHMSCMAVNFIHYNKSIMHQADLVLISPVVPFGVFEFTAVDDIIKVGYDAIKMQLNSWRKAGGQLPPHTVFE